jgi:hypothetical protein
MGFDSSPRGGRIGYKVMVRDYDEAVRYQKELAMAKDSTADERHIEDKGLQEAKDIQEAPQPVQDLYGHLWGEKDNEEL